MLTRVLEPELMDTQVDASEYDAMDHAAVNAQFASDLLQAIADWSLQRPVKPDSVINVLDLGAGTAQIPIELARRAPHLKITAVDAAQSMLAIGHKNVDDARLVSRIELLRADAKDLPFDAATFAVVISNSIAHHIAEPRQVIAEAVRVCVPGGLLFHRDLARPDSDEQLQQIVAAYAGDATPYQRKLFDDSLRAALTLDETQQLVVQLGFARDSVHMTSDRHWTWIATR